MRSHLRIACAILLAGLASGSSDAPTPSQITLPTQANLNKGDHLTLQVLTFDDVVVSCSLESPSGSITKFKPDESGTKFEVLTDTDLSQCRALMLIEDTDDGLWTLTSTAAHGRERVQGYNITVNLGADSGNKRVDYLEKKYINTTIGYIHEIAIPDFEIGHSDSCSLINPHGVRIQVADSITPYIPGISQLHDSSCSVAISVKSPDFIGDWMLISDGYKYSENVERRLPFTIHVEKFVAPAAETLKVREGNDFYIAAKYYREELPRNCRLLGPHGVVPAEKYKQKGYRCYFRVFNVTMADSGNWEINYGDKILYRAITRLIVQSASDISPIELNWTRDRPVEETLGPDHAIYCKIATPEGYIAYNGFGKCRINLDRAIKSQHQGVWKMEVGMPGQVLTDSYTVNVVVQEPAPRPTVQTQMASSPGDVYKQNITLSCSLDSPDPIGFCKFRDPSGRILIAAQSVGESRYSWHGSGTNYTAGIHSHECGIRITNTTLKDFGIWRCEIDTKGGTYYGFLTARASWIRDPEIAATITTVPTLTADRSSISSLSEDSVTMTCSIQAPIRYCYFRTRNGTVYNVSPSDSHDFATYVGAGFEAGECGIKFPSLATSDSGVWSCHVGLLDPQKPEQRARFEVTINDTMVVSQYGPFGDVLDLEAHVNNHRPLDYCRFVRIDGFGFTEANVPPNVDDRSDLSRGICAIAIRTPTNLDLHPWVIVARIRGQDTEVTRLTDIAFSIPQPPSGGGGQFRIPGAWIIVMSIGMCMILLASFIGPKKNREWTYARANAIRNSFKTKKVAQNADDVTKTTAVAA